MNTPWINTADALPPEGIYVLVHLTNTNWHDSSDPKGVYYKVAKLVRGISQYDRIKMQADLSTRHRARVIRLGDQHGNNLVPYCWKEFGPADYFGQEVDRWMHIP